MDSQLNGLPFKNIKSASLFDLQAFYRIKPVSLFRSIYKVFTGSNQSPYFYLQGFYSFKSVSLFSIYKILQGQTRFPFRFTMFLQAQTIPYPFNLKGIYRIFSSSEKTTLF